jgi:hypothetical protein
MYTFGTDVIVFKWVFLVVTLNVFRKCKAHICLMRWKFNKETSETHRRGLSRWIAWVYLSIANTLHNAKTVSRKTIVTLCTGEISIGVVRLYTDIHSNILFIFLMLAEARTPFILLK